MKNPVRLYADAYAEYRQGNLNQAAKLLTEALGAQETPTVLARNLRLFFDNPLLSRSVEHAVAVGERNGPNV